MLTAVEQHELEKLRAELEALGGRSVELANRIDELENKALTPFERAIREYGDNIHGYHGNDPEVLEIFDLDPNAKYLLVQRNVRGGYWLSSFDDRDDAYTYHISDEYAEDWLWETLIELESGKSYHPKTVKVAEWVEYGADGKLIV